MRIILPKSHVQKISLQHLHTVFYFPNKCGLHLFPENINMNPYLCKWCPTKNTSCSERFVMNGVAFMKDAYIKTLLHFGVQLTATDVLRVDGCLL